MREIYLDNNATTRPLPEVVVASTRAMNQAYGNASSPHRRGEIARQVLQEARQNVAALVGCDPEAIVFTSGGTEANNMVLNSFCGSHKSARLVISVVEHSSVLKVAEYLGEAGVEIEILDVDNRGKVSPEQLEKALDRPASLVSIQWANSEIGTLQPIEQLGTICRSRRVPFHVDAAQAVGKMPIDLKRLPVSCLTFTAHKLHGPQGVGAIASNSLETLQPIFQGGEQESGKRPGTENLAGIAGFGQAAKMRGAALSDSMEKLCNLRDAFEQQILKNHPTVLVNGDRDDRNVSSTNILFPGVDGMAMMAQLDNEGVCCSLTSACVSARPEPSHVLLAIGLSEQQAYSSLRFSFSILNSSEEAKLAASKVSAVYDRLLGLSHKNGKVA